MTYSYLKIPYADTKARELAARHGYTWDRTAQGWAKTVNSPDDIPAELHRYAAQPVECWECGYPTFATTCRRCGTDVYEAATWTSSKLPVTGVMPPEPQQ